MSVRENRRECPSCGNSFTGHPNKRFCGQRCKDRYHNSTNPRGFQAGLFKPHLPMTDAEIAADAGLELMEAGWDGHKNAV